MTKPAIPRETLGLLLGLTGVIIFGGSLPFTRLAVEELDAGFISFARPLIASVVALTVLIVRRCKLPPRRDLIRLFIAAFCLTYGWPGLANLAMVTVPATHGGVVTGILPLATAVAAAIMIRDRPPLAFWALALLGAAIIVTFAIYRGAGAPLPGDTFLFIGMAICAVGYVLVGELSRRYRAWEVLFWQLVMMLPFSLVGTIWFWQPNISAIHAGPWIGFWYTVIFSQLIGLFSWNWGLALGGVARISQLQLLQTFVAIGWALLINHEPFDALAVLAAIAIVGIIIATRRVRRA